MGTDRRGRPQGTGGGGLARHCKQSGDLVSGGWVTHADHARWQLQAARELAVILGAYGDLPLLVWTVIPAGPLLEARLTGHAPAEQVRGTLAAWREALGLEGYRDGRAAAGRPGCTRRGCAARSGSGSSRPSSRRLGEHSLTAGCRCRQPSRAGRPGARAPGETAGRRPPGVPPGRPGVRAGRPGSRGAFLRGHRVRPHGPGRRVVPWARPSLAARGQAGSQRVHRHHHRPAEGAPEAGILPGLRLSLRAQGAGLVHHALPHMAAGGPP